jgi:hypothetical protein
MKNDAIFFLFCSDIDKIGGALNKKKLPALGVGVL